MPNPAKIRQAIRAKRRSLTTQEHRANSLSAATHFICNPQLIHCNHIALYLAADGELDTQPLIRRLRQLHKKLYLPVLKPGTNNSLWFAEYRDGERLIPNRFGIAEPNIRHSKPKPAWSLDLIVMPLVAFNSEGTRIGMGGGYYDRTLSYQLRHQRWIRPKLVGYAHAFQCIEELTREHWDVPLHGIITERGYKSYR
ncbi:5-formyltetrahydrofolate cyclo-ligase [Sedimenticola sp.]|uniref:5-formyltetrahydrofolate cyclo-ligase n=1 Tax=Sedimenticola sp. TaxID=1940285 RepID=UPI003D13F2C8